MGSKAWDEMVNPSSTVGSDFDSWVRQQGYSPSGHAGKYEKDTGEQVNSGSFYDLSKGTRKSYIDAGILQNLYQQQLGFSSGGNLSSLANPFGTGGSGSGGSGAPTVNTSNRFEAGLSDAELRLKNLLDNPDSIQQTAAYKFRVNQGQEALQRQLAAKGLLNSGNRLMELTKYGQDMGSQEYDNQFGRIKDLVGGYSGSWIGDKNANTSLFNAQANAWNTAQANADRNRYQMGMLDVERNKPVSGSYGVNSGFDKALYTTDNGQTAWDNNAKNEASRIQNDAAQYALDRQKNIDRWGY